MADTNVSVRIGTETYATTVRAGSHEIVSDVGPELGGSDTGASPKELLLASIGACKAMTARMYADRKGWPLTGIGLELAYTPARPGEAEQINAVLTFEGDLDDAQRARLLEIAEKCPVQKLITGELSVEASLASPA